MPEANYFPSTLRSRIADWLERSDRVSLNQHVLTTYYEPIRLYLKGSRWYAARVRGNGRGGRSQHGEVEELNDLVNGFFTDLLEREDFFDRWAASGHRLGKYLRGALWLYLKGLYRDHARELEGNARLTAAEPDAEHEEPPDRDLDKAFVTSLVAQAMDEARQACERKGFGAHWKVLVRHFCDGASYPDVARELGVRPDRAAVMLRTASSYFEQSFKSLVTQQVREPEQVRRAIQSFLEVIES
jgi:hypothetical protein